MFFRREKERKLTFDNRLQQLRDTGFAVQPEGSGKARITKHGCGAMLEDAGSGSPGVSKAGMVVGTEIGYLVNGGYQQFFVTPTGRKEPAQARHLRALHDFQEDLKESLGMTSLYNTSLGTTSDRHMYDRVANRDRGVPQRPWEPAAGASNKTPN